MLVANPKDSGQTFVAFPVKAQLFFFIRTSSRHHVNNLSNISPSLSYSTLATITKCDKIVTHQAQLENPYSLAYVGMTNNLKGVST